MHFEQLNDDILLLILNFLELETAVTTSKWKANIPFIQVNRRWRRLASSFTHKNVLFETKEIDYDTSTVCTNISIVTAAYGFKHIRNLIINLNYYEYIPTIFKMLYKLLVKHGSRLTATKSVFMKMLITDAYEEVEEINMQIMSRLSKLIIRVMPNVTNLELYDVQKTVILEQFYGNIISGYHNQLIRLVSRKGFTLPQDYSLSKLLCLDMDVSDNHPFSLSIFHVVADTLVVLALHGVSAYFPWNRFGNNNSDIQSPNSITFGCLTRLDIYFLPYDRYSDNESEIQVQPMTLHFPLLERMYVNNYSSDCGFLQNFVFPEYVEILRMLSSSENFVSLAYSEIFLPKSNNFTLESSYNPNDDIEENDYNMISEYRSNAINNFLKKYHGSKQTRLASTTFYEFNPDSNVARLAKLSTIYLTRCEYMKTAINVIEKVPDLVTLHVIANSEFEPLGFAWKDSLNNAEPYNTNIKELSLNQICENQKTKENYVADAIYMILRIRSLERLNVEDFSCQQIKEFVQENKEKYPHLEKIDISIGSYFDNSSVEGL